MLAHGCFLLRPACLRLRVVADPTTIDPRFLCSAERIDQASEIVAQYWPESIVPDELANVHLLREVQAARRAMLDAMGLTILT